MTFSLPALSAKLTQITGQPEKKEQWVRQKEGLVAT
jgi:hypothetical protein